MKFFTGILFLGLARAVLAGWCNTDSEFDCFEKSNLPDSAQKHAHYYDQGPCFADFGSYCIVDTGNGWALGNFGCNCAEGTKKGEESAPTTTTAAPPPPPSGVSADCGEVYGELGLTASQRNTIVEKHNELRNKVASGQEILNSQPAAKNMKKIEWNDDLAITAQRLVNTCNFAHDSRASRETAENPDDVGQNIAQSSSSSITYVYNMTAPVQSWYDEVKDFNSLSCIDSFNNTQATNNGTVVTGHYTQVVWANVERVGCGLIKYKKSGSPWYTTFVACNYWGPASTGYSGNMGGREIYERGTPVACPSGFTKEATTNLCKKD